MLQHVIENYVSTPRATYHKLFRLSLCTWMEVDHLSHASLAITINYVSHVRIVMGLIFHVLLREYLQLV